MTPPHAERDDETQITAELIFRALTRYSSRFDTILEIGCGAGAQTPLLAALSRRVIATEFVESDDPRVSSYGIGAAKKVLASVPRVHLLICDVRALPFRDNSVDLIYSLSMLEHIPEQDRALREMGRVVKPSGLVVAGVPGFMWLLWQYVGWIPVGVPRLAVRWLRARRRYMMLKASNQPIPKPIAKDVGESPPASLWSWDILRRLVRHLFPPIHGMYPTRWEEWRRYRLRRWIELFERNDLQVVQSLGLSFFWLFPQSLRMYEATVPLTLRLSASPLLRLANGFAFIARRKRETSGLSS